jgi:hypothetical protein
VTHYNGKGEPLRTVHKRRLIMPAKVEAADGIRKMLGWDKVVKAARSPRGSRRRSVAGVETETGLAKRVEITGCEWFWAAKNF